MTRLVLASAALSCAAHPPCIPTAMNELASHRLVADYHGAGIVVERASLDQGDPAHVLAAIQQVGQLRPQAPADCLQMDAFETDVSTLALCGNGLQLDSVTS